MRVDRALDGGLQQVDVDAGGWRRRLLVDLRQRAERLADLRVGQCELTRRLDRQHAVDDLARRAAAHVDSVERPSELGDAQAAVDVAKRAELLPARRKPHAARPPATGEPRKIEEEAEGDEDAAGDADDGEEGGVDVHEILEGSRS